MPNDTISRIEAMLQDSSLNADEKRKLLELVAGLKQELQALPKEGAEKAASVAAFAELATREAMRQEKDPALLEHATSGLDLAQQRLSKDYPKLARIVNQFCDFLSGSGI